MSTSIPAGTGHDDYTALRTTVGAYRISAPLVRITGAERFTFLDALLSRSSAFVEPNTVREALSLRPDGSAFAIWLHLEIDDESWLLPRTPVTAEDVRTHLDALDLPEGVTVETEPEGWGATALEGPQTWSAVARFIEFDISGLTLHAVTEAALPGTPDALAHLARVGTTGEYGYLLLSNAPQEAHEAVCAAAREQGGTETGPSALARVQAEAGMGVYSSGFAGLSVSQADLAWMIDWNRLGEFNGSQDLVKPSTSTGRLTALLAPAGSKFISGTEVKAAGRPVGSVIWQAPSANPDEELLLALLGSPFWVPGLALSAEGRESADLALRTVSMPCVIARSNSTRIS